jgi:hypothetical protein
MLYVKALHLLAIISWMAGVFYLPRIFVHYVEGQRAGEDVRRLAVMARKLYHFTSIMAVFSLGSGLWLWLTYGFAGGWIHASSPWSCCDRLSLACCSAAAEGDLCQPRRRCAGTTSCRCQSVAISTWLSSSRS